MVRAPVENNISTYPTRILDKVRAAGALIYPLGVYAIVNGHLRLPHQLTELWVICEVANLTLNVIYFTVALVLIR